MTETTRLPTQAELAARIEGLSQMLLCLTAQLEISGLIDGPRLSRNCRERAEHLGRQDWHPTVQWQMETMTAALDQARAARQSRGDKEAPAHHAAHEVIAQHLNLLDVRTEYLLHLLDAREPTGRPAGEA